MVWTKSGFHASLLASWLLQIQVFHGTRALTVLELKSYSCAVQFLEEAAIEGIISRNQNNKVAFIDGASILIVLVPTCLTL